MKLRFEKRPDPENRFDSSIVSMEIEEVSLPEILNSFQDFLKGCGFIFEGDLEIVNDSLTQEIEND